MFRRRRGAATAEPTPTPFEIGRYGTDEDFRRANQQAVQKTKKPGFDTEGKYAEYAGAEDQSELRRGAVQAFTAGHPANIRTALLYLEELAIHKGFLSVYQKYPEDARRNIVSDLIKAGSDPSAVITQALLVNVAEDEKQDLLDQTLLHVVRDIMPGGEAFSAALLSAGAHDLPVTIKRIMLKNVEQDKKQETLDNLLIRVLRKEISGGEALIAGLLDADADANATEGDYKGVPLVYAVQYDQPLSVIEKLYKKVARFEGDTQFFDDAIESMKIKGYEGEMVPGVKGMDSVKGTNVLNRMKALRQKYTGQPATVEIQPEVLQKLLDDFAAAREEITTLTARLAETPAPATQRLKLTVQPAVPR